LPTFVALAAFRYQPLDERRLKLNAILESVFKPQ
jgi:hypothetical protein